MQIGIPLEARAGEKRVAATPETVKKLSALHKVSVQKGAGIAANIPDSEFEAAGAVIVPTAEELYANSEMILKVRGLMDSEFSMVKKGTMLIGLLSPHDREKMAAYAEAGITAFAMESIPRISRAQSMDVLSSQANIGGYKSVMLAANAYGRFMPMLMTAAGTVKAARVLILGVGVAGLQAIATAKRLGAVIEAFDVRPAVKEQVLSLGAKFVEVPLAEGESAETSGGYAKEMSEDYKRKQSELIHARAIQSDIVITTALIPGRPAPVLLQEETVKAMKPGSVVVDMAVEFGGNCPLSEKDAVVEKYGVTLIGYSNLPAMVAADASALYARNMLNFISLMLDAKTGELKLDRQDEIIAGTLVSIDGELVKK
ncbi:MAG: Re/Si-specific NAD(P)(+) transhydrogenase subunit alpha [Burkholderiales bacterium]|nr:Re/Si-specific NAD(P)(+) transhydrogenase subunit alpha [Burkholderiales bacterium]